MDKHELKTRLESMYDDMNFSNDKANYMLSLITDTNEDKEVLLKNIYFNDNSPLKIINYVYAPKGDCDYTGEILNISLKYDYFVKGINDTAQSLMRNYTNAVKLFLIVLSLPEPYSLLLYLRYYKRMNADDVMQKLHLSRTTYYRLYDRALSHTMDAYKGVNV
ncbi:MAG: DUF1492 domain-containing protein [Saccharofermentans sp.]|nr:DUF1492 domain-containing protein [Saccharofermentans sp.]